MTAPDSILKLVEQFQLHLKSYKSMEYNETQARREFIDPFFEALGWDVFNRQGYAHAYKDVIHEDAIKVGGATKAPDYAFRIGGTRKFFVEAKKPSVSLKDEISPAYQLRRYAWSAKLPLSILTDFEEFAVYDCRLKPTLGDKASTGRTMLLTFQDYPGRWDEIAAIFSREAILKGSFDQYAESNKGKHGTAEVDDAFLAEIERWRDLLARNIALRNPALSQQDLNYAVQMTIDRLIFLRICEDRGIEFYGQLQALLNGNEIYPRLCQIFRQADARFNSGLFHFQAEKGQAEAPDGLTLGLALDDKPLKDILANLYYPESPYEFSVLPADILGQVYEQFLGKVIRLTAGHHAVVEDKPEVKKAGGVFYTPTYIVEYIVRHTLGRLLEGKHPGDAGVGRGAPVRVLDMACGSGSFLIVAYQTLLDWYLNEYLQQGAEQWAKGRSPRLAQSSAGEWRLTTAERKRILLDHIYGVDIDPQAVEVTKLSLLLKVLEGESEETVGKQLSMFHERALPDLGQNIKCGNSLIGSDFYANAQASFLDGEEQRRINAFDWEREFPQVFGGQGIGERGQGFDVVVGNPPYIRIQALKEWAPKEVEFYKQRYHSASKGNYDIYVVFVEKGLSLLNPNGRLGYILPSKFFATDYGEILRNILVDKKSLSRIVDFGHMQVFEQATTYTCLLFLNGSQQQSFEYAKVSSPQDLTEQLDFRLIGNLMSNKPWVFEDDISSTLAQKIHECSKPLGELPARIGRGSSSGSDQVFILKRVNDGYFTQTGEKVDIEAEIFRIPIYATSFGRYKFHPHTKEAIIFPYKVNTEGYTLISESELKLEFPKTYKYLSSRRKMLEERKQFKAWYSFSAPRNLNVHDTAELLVPLLADRGLYCRLLDESTNYCLMASGGFSITVDSTCGLSPNYVLGLLNSSLLFWRLRSISNIFRGGWITCTKQYVETLPIRTINFSDPAEVQQHARMVALVERMLNLQRELAAAQTPAEKTRLQRQVDATDAQIDALVYALYGLTEEEVGVVEGR